VVTNPDSQTVTKTAAYTYVAPTPAPTVTALSPSRFDRRRHRGDHHRTNFVSLPTVTFGGTAATVVFGSATSLTATTAAHSAGVVDVVVTNPDSQTVTKTAA